VPLLHDAAYRTQLIARVQSLTPDTPARWGKMTVDQMLWHVSSALEMALGRTQLQSGKPPLPRPIMRFVVLTLPWPKNLPTNPELVAKQRHDFLAERPVEVRIPEHRRDADRQVEQQAIHRLAVVQHERLKARDRVQPLCLYALP